MKEGSFHWSYLRIFLVIGSLSIWILLELNIEKSDLVFFVPHTSNDPHLINNSTYYKGFLVNTNGCRIPDLDPWDSSIRKYIFDEKPINCEEQFGGPPLVESDLTSVFINESLLHHYNVTSIDQLNCCYTPFFRVQLKKTASGKYPSDVDHKIRMAKHCIPFSASATISHEFIKVECKLNNDSIYTDFHAFFPSNLSNKTQEEKLLEDKNAVSVLLFGVDAVSRLNLYRQMPKTLKFLKKTLNAVEMLGYNKVEDNTFPNLVPVLTGLSVEELKKTCWPKTNNVFDNCTFIWNTFSKIGYTTAFGEDASWMGIFNYVKRGFRKQPTNYYMSVFNRICEDKLGSEKRLNAFLCVGPRKTVQTLINYAYKFVLAMKRLLSFGFFWGVSLTHDYVNLPKQGDEEHKQFLENLFKQGVFNNTVMIFMSDHGIRWGGIRGTYQGYLEERLPFLFVVYPDWFRIKFTSAVSNLKRNAQKLTTPFDVHELLSDLSDISSLEKDKIRMRSDELEKKIPRGISLFLPIPSKRTCSDAGIDDHWCTCHQSSKINTNDSNVKRAANHVIKHVNSLLQSYSQCAKLRLSQIISAREEKSVSHSSFTVSDEGIRDYSLTIETTPGKALFEATVRHNGNLNVDIVVGTISRINLYGDQSNCMPEYKLRLYCYCTHE